MRRLSIAISAVHAASTSPSAAALTAVAKSATLADIAGGGSSGWYFDHFAGSMPRSSQRDVFRRHIVTQLTDRTAACKAKLVPIARAHGPPSAFVIYDDALRNGFDDYSWGTYTLSETAVVHSGTTAASFVPKNWEGLYFHHPGVDTSGFHSIEIYMNGGPTGGEAVQVAVWDGNTLLGSVDVAQVLGHPLGANTWERVVVPFSSVGLSGRPLRDLYIEDNSGALSQPTIYVDDVRLIP
jgi:hypothetical protein